MISTLGKGPFRAFAGVCLSALILGGCSSVSEFADNINPFGGEDILEGERQALFDNADAGIVGDPKPASIGSATGGQSWPNSGGDLSNDPGNVAISVSGSRAWTSRVGSSGGGFGAAALRVSSRPVSDGSRIFVFKPNGEVVALSTGGGRAWSQNLRPEGEKDTASGGGVATASGRVFAATGYGQVVSLDAGSGQVAWTADLDSPARGAPTAGAGHVFVVTQNNEVVALKQEDGSLAWSYVGIEETAGLLSAANPAISGNRVIVPFSSGEIMALDIKKGEPVWIEGVARGFRTLALSGLADVSASPVISGDTVYATGVAGRTVAVSLKSGQRQWGVDLGSVHTPIVSGSAVFMIDLDNRMVALSRKTGDTLWTTELPRPEKKKKRRNWAGPILANGTLVAFSSDGYIAKVDAASGRLVGSNNVNTDVFVTPIVAGGRIIVLHGDDGVAAFN